MKKKKIQIAINNLVVSGTGTQAKLIVKHNDLLYLDTGRPYWILGKFI